MGAEGSLRAWALAAVIAVACGDDGGARDAAPRDGAANPDGPAPDAPLVLDHIQCRSSDDCIPLTQSGCFQSRAGGVCTDCGEQGDRCPEGTMCIMGGTSSMAGTECAFPCTTDDDCNLGMYCTDVGNQGKFCQPRRCGDGMPPCPYPYTFCRETTAPLFECSRPMCAAGCPPPLYCPPGGAFCIEP